MLNYKNDQIYETNGRSLHTNTIIKKTRLNFTYKTRINHRSVMKHLCHHAVVLKLF